MVSFRPLRIGLFPFQMAFPWLIDGVANHLLVVAYLMMSGLFLAWRAPFPQQNNLPSSEPEQPKQQLETPMAHILTSTGWLGCGSNKKCGQKWILTWNLENKWQKKMESLFRTHHFKVPGVKFREALDCGRVVFFKPNKNTNPGPRNCFHCATFRKTIRFFWNKHLPKNHQETGPKKLSKTTFSQGPGTSQWLMFRGNLRRSKDHNQRRQARGSWMTSNVFDFFESWILMRFCIFLSRNCGINLSNVRYSMDGILTCNHPTEVFCFFVFFL